MWGLVKGMRVGISAVGARGVLGLVEGMWEVWVD